MNSYRLTRPAQNDVIEIWTYIAYDNVEAAERVEQAIRDAFAFVAANPYRGHTRLDLTSKPMRFWTLPQFPNYSIAYRPDANPVEILAVLHGKLNSRRVLKHRL